MIEKCHGKSFSVLYSLVWLSSQFYKILQRSLIWLPFQFNKIFQRGLVCWTSKEKRSGIPGAEGRECLRTPLWKPTSRKPRNLSPNMVYNNNVPHLTVINFYDTLYSILITKQNNFIIVDNFILAQFNLLMKN